MFEQLGGRKLVASILVMVVGVVITAIKGDIPDGLLQLLEVTIGSFVGGNVASNLVGVLSTNRNGASPDVAPKEDGDVVPANPAPVADVTPPAAEAPVGPSAADLYAGLQVIHSKVEAVEAGMNAQLKTITEGSVVVQRSVNKLIELALKQ